MSKHDLRDPRLVWWPDGPPAHCYAFADYAKIDHGGVSHAPDLPALEPLPIAHSSCDACVVVEPFVLPRHPEGYLIHATASWELVTTDAGVPVGIYRRSYGMRVHAAHQRRSIGLHMAVWRSERRGVAPPFAWHRSPATWAMLRPAHRLLIQRALQRGAPVPAHVLSEYPDLAKGSP